MSLPHFRFLALLFVMLPLAVQAAERVALVIGNNTYDKTKPARTAPNLVNAIGDAEAVRAMLMEKLGFKEEDVIHGKDLGRVEIHKKLEEFRRKAAGAKLALIYYAGHGMESLDGTANFILPVDVETGGVAQSDAVLRASGIDLGAELRLLGQAAPAAAKVVIMDCCRDRPATRNAVAPRGGGLAAVAEDAIPAGTLIVLAAAPGQTAEDGRKQGPLAAALLEILAVPGRNLLDGFYAAGDKVEELTQGRQVVWLKAEGSARVFRELTLIPAGKIAPAQAERIARMLEDATAQFNRGDYAAAYKTAGEVVELDPGNAWGWNLKGGGAINLREFAEAVFCFTTAHRLVPQNAEILFNLAECHYVQHSWQSAERRFADLIGKQELGEEYVLLARFKILVCRAKLGDLAEARKIAAAFAADPRTALQADFARAVLLFEDAKAAEARKLIAPHRGSKDAAAYNDSLMEAEYTEGRPK